MAAVHEWVQSTNPSAAGPTFAEGSAEGSLEARLARLEAQVSSLQKLLDQSDLPSAKGAALPTDAGSDSEVLSDSSSSLFIEEGEGDGEPPDSLFAYTVVRLAFGQGRGQTTAMMQLVTLVLVELILAGSFLDCTRCRMIVNRWAPPQPDVSNACFYKGSFFNDGTPDLYLRSRFSYPKIWKGQPFSDLLVGLICLIVLGLYVRDSNVRLLSLAASVKALETNMGPWLRHLLFVAERMRTLVVPTFVLIGAALQLTNCPDVIDIILNAFAVTFLLDMDRLLFAVALGTKEKIAYKKLWEAKGMRAFHHSDRWAIKWILLLDLVALGSGFFLPRVLDWSEGEAFQYEVKKFVGQTCKYVGFTRAFLFEVSIARSEAKQGGAGQMTLQTGACSLVWALFDLIFCVFMYGMINWPLFQTDTMLDYESISACLNGTDLDACHC